MGNKDVISGLTPHSVFNYFAEIGEIPRGSGNTTKIADYLVLFAENKNLKVSRDSNNNVIIRKESNTHLKSTIALQAHIDMVCVKTSDCEKNMQTDGIEFCIEGDYLKAKNTTLGADDGIGIAIIMSILHVDTDYDRDVVGIFTADEENGMNGVLSINTESIIDVKNFINIDSEEYNVFVVGCAGGTQLEYEKEYELVSVNNKNIYNLDVDGCIGGHSGTEITKNRLNANKLVINILKKLKNNYELMVENIIGGDFNNAIPTSCRCNFIIENHVTYNDIKSIIDNEIKDTILKYPNEVNLKYNLNEMKNSNLNVYSITDTSDIIDMFYELPNGLIEKHEEFPNIAKTSLNLGIIRCEKGKVSFAYLVRSNVDDERLKLNKEIDVVTKKYLYKNSLTSSYPAWEYKKSDLSNYVVDILDKLYNESPVFEITHGGLECGILLKKLPNANAISIGPTILGAHTTEEKLEIKTVEKIYNFVVEMIKSVD